MGRHLVRYAVDKGAELVGAFDVRAEVIGRRVSEVFEGVDSDVVVSDAAVAEAVLSELKPDVCIVATRSTMREIKDILLTCARLGINAVTTCEEAFYPWNSSPDITREIDEVARESGARICGSGYPDVYWGTLVGALAGSVQTITKIQGSSSYNVEDYGLALAEGHGAGLTLEEFKQKIGQFNDLSPEKMARKIQSGEIAPSYMWNQNGWLAARLGLHVTAQTQECLAQTHTEDLVSQTLEMTVKAGDATGMAARVVTQTAEGITLETESIGKVYAPGEIDSNTWTIHGQPDVTFTVDRPATVELTCATIINRIPQLLQAPAGYVTTDQLPVDNFQVTIS
jgi:4-hydroxy-tetrahydrodipicolinate reductase